jgi:hypothetical protein
MQEDVDVLPLSHQVFIARRDKLDLMCMAMKMMVQEGVKLYYMDHQAHNLKAILWGKPLPMPDQSAKVVADLKQMRSAYINGLKLLKMPIVPPSTMRQVSLKTIQQSIDGTYKPMLEEIDFIRRGLPRTEEFYARLDKRERLVTETYHRMLGAINDVKRAIELDMDDKQLDEYLGFSGLSRGLNIL